MGNLPRGSIAPGTGNGDDVNVFREPGRVSSQDHRGTADDDDPIYLSLRRQQFSDCTMALIRTGALLRGFTPGTPPAVEPL